MIEVGPELGFRPGTKQPTYAVNFAMNDGGLGDYVNYASATRWVAENCPWIMGHLFLPNYLVGLMQDIHAEFSHWRVYPGEKALEYLVDGGRIVGPSIHRSGININPQLLTVLSTHPMDVGFAYFAGMTPAPENVYLPRLDYERHKLLPKVKQIKGPYAVFTTGGTTQARTVQGKHLNPVIRYVKSLGITPVFVGKEDHIGDGKNTVKYSSDLAFAEGVDLRNQTTVRDAACILQHAKFTIGLDCGLLHLASLMNDSNVIFGYNITNVEHRRPRRNWGKTVNIAVSAEELACTGCQSRWRQLHTHMFDKCRYGDVLCVDLLFKDDGARWKSAIDEVLA